MATIWKHGILLGVLVAAWTYVMGFTGWYKDPALQSLFWVVILIEVFVLLSALRATASQGATYGTQIGAGLAVASVAGVIIFVNSFLFTGVVFPRYFDEIRTLGGQVMRQQGMSEEAVTEQLRKTAGMYTPFSTALQGFIGTVVTGMIVSLIAAIWIRGKSPAAPTTTQAS